MVLGGAIIVIFTVKGFSAYGQAITLSQIANSIVADIQRRIFDKMLSMSLASYSSRHSTEFIARQAFISQSASNSLNLIINGIAKDGFTIVGLLGVMVLQDPFMSVLALVVTPLHSWAHISSAGEPRSCWPPSSKASKSSSSLCKRPHRAFA